MQLTGVKELHCSAMTNGGVEEGFGGYLQPRLYMGAQGKDVDLV